MWIPPETRDPVVLHHPTRQGVGYFGAVCLQDGRFIHRREEDRFNAVSFGPFSKICGTGAGTPGSVWS